MFINRLINQGNLPLVEQTLRFTARRHSLLAENIANIDTPHYRQKDLDPAGFQAALRDRVSSRAGRPTSSVRFDGMSSDADLLEPQRGILFHDGANRSSEQLMTDLAKNALTHNLYAELMRRQFSSIQNALKERVS